VIFSSWRPTLDIVHYALDSARVGCVLVDGCVSPPNYKLALEKLRYDPQACVYLITISCGAVGLGLTTASRAYLLEPQWNPTTQEQALARVHRMGQTRTVRTVRFVVGGSFEDVCKARAHTAAGAHSK
ncbi:uncharacterized protein K452DRAFT_224834, partial [Aplosporella prunicola CBS 121167]